MRGVRRIAIGWLIVAATVLAACTSSHSSNKDGVPKDYYDLAVYLCTGNLTVKSGCKQAITTDAQVTELRHKVRADPSVVDMLYIDKEGAYQIGVRTFSPNATPYLKVGDFPATFLVVLKGGVRTSTPFQARVKDLPGVRFVQACYGRATCSVTLLRTLHLIAPGHP